jgi:hypothetical protein
LAYVLECVRVVLDEPTAVRFTPVVSCGDGLVLGGEVVGGDRPHIGEITGDVDEPVPDRYRHPILCASFTGEQTEIVQAPKPNLGGAGCLAFVEAGGGSGPLDGLDDLRS